MQGYWALPEQTAKRFFVERGRHAAGIGPATSSPKTQDGCYTYRGRRDRMVKRRGYRVELGEIEAGLYRPSQHQGGGRRRLCGRTGRV